MMEWENEEIWQAYRDRAEATGLGSILNHITNGYLESTPGGGYHTFYRCGQIDGNLKLAMINGKVAIETRGEGGFCVTAPSHGKVHPTGNPYVLLNGGFDSIIPIHPNDREMLHALARSFDESPPKVIKEAPREYVDSDRPGDIFNRTATWEEILEPHGWVHAFDRGGGEGFWRRSGKTHGISATTNYGGSNLLHIFTSSTTFEPGTAYSKFTAYTILNHGGDFRSAASTLADKGYKPIEESKAPAISSGRTKDGLHLKRGSEIEEEKVEFLWYPFIPYGKITMVTGDPGVGKSELMLAVGKRTGEDILFISAEDGAGDTLVPRFRKMGGDLDRLVVLDSVTAGGKERMLDLQYDVPMIGDTLRWGDYSMVVLDPLNAFLPGVDVFKDNQVRTILSPLARIAEMHKVAIVCIRHMSKGSGDKKAIYRGQNSIGFTAAARSELMVSPNPYDEEEILVHHIKASNGLKSRVAVAFKILSDPAEPDGAPLFEWGGDRDIDIEDEQRDPEAKSKLQQAAEFLTELLKSGPVESVEVEKWAKDQGHSMKTVRRAGTELGVRVEAIKDLFGKTDHWEWAMPDKEEPSCPPVGQSE